MAAAWDWKATPAALDIPSLLLRFETRLKAKELFRWQIDLRELGLCTEWTLSRAVRQPPLGAAAGLAPAGELGRVPFRVVCY